jgi:hypothetical protein
MEEPARVTGTRRRAAAVLAGLTLGLGVAAVRADEAELSRAVRALGAPGTLWGRLAVEEESPDGPWTPLAGVAITVYPYTAQLAADLERIRDGARASGRDYDAAIARFQERLGAHASQVGAITGIPVPAPASSGAPSPTPSPSANPATPATPATPPPTPGILAELAGRLGLAEKPGAAPARSEATATGSGDGASSSTEGLVRRATTDATGVFLFKFLPAGDWLVVAIQTSSYSAPRRQPSSSTRASPGKNRDGFLESARPQAKEAEVWVIRTRVMPDEPARLLLTDRSRFMVGPVR